MVKARPARELVLRMPNEIGTLSTIAKTLSDKGFNIIAVSAWVEGADVLIHLITDDASRALDTLKAHRFAVHQKDVIVCVVPHKPGMLRGIAEKLAHDEIDIHHLYATASSSQNESLVVFATANNDRALVLLNSGPR